MTRLFYKSVFNNMTKSAIIREHPGEMIPALTMQLKLFTKINRMKIKY